MTNAPFASLSPTCGPQPSDQNAPGAVASYPEEVAHAIESDCEQGELIQLQPQQRVPLRKTDGALILKEGMLAIDAMPEKGKLQILDFLMAGDVVSPSIVLPTPRVSLRAITKAALVSVNPPETCYVASANVYWTSLVGRYLNQMARVNIHQLMIGRLEAELRVASFLLRLALRNCGTTIELPMSRTDIANYLIINCDTLSRIMMRFAACGVIERKGRHAIRITDLEALRKKSPLAPVLSAVLESN